jgi:glycosyltransferase involved in cell wall biosynthesis
VALCYRCESSEAVRDVQRVNRALDGSASNAQCNVVPFMRIILTTQGLLPLNGGLARSVPLLASTLAEQGVEVHLVAPGYGAHPSAMLLPSKAVRTHILPQQILRVFPNAWQGRFLFCLWRGSFARTMRELPAAGNSALVHDNGLWLATNHWAATSAKRMSVPLIISPRGMLSEWAMQHRSWRKRIAWKYYQGRDLETAQVIHATSSEEANQIRNAQLRQPIAVIPNGVELSPFIGDRPVKNFPKTLLFLSRINPKKGLTMLADAWASLRPAMWRVVVAGFDEGGHQQKIQEHVKRLGIDSSFEFIGPVIGDEKWSLFNTADAFVLPSYSENFGIAVAEALSAGLPVITTQGTPWSDIAIRKCGWWVKADQASLEGALREVMQLSHEERNQMGIRGRRLVEEKFAWPAIARQMREVYAWALGKTEKPACVLTT